MTLTGGYKRSVVNMNFTDYVNDYIWIDLVQNAYITNAGGYPVDCDAQGYPKNSSSKDGLLTMGSATMLASNIQYGGNYVVTGLGSGTIQIGNFVNFSAVGAGTNCTFSGNGTITSTATGNNRWRILVTLSSHTFWSFAEISFSVNDPNATGDYIRDVHMYRTTDEADFIGTYPSTGVLTPINYFRAAFKNALVALNPCAIRFMNWTGGPDKSLLRWSSRLKPSYYASAAGGAGAGGTDLGAGPFYGTATYQTSPSTDKTKYIFTNTPSGMPPSYTHGEQGYGLFTNDWITPQGTTSAAVRIDNHAGAITNSNPATIRIGSQPFANGDVVQFYDMSGMPKLDMMIGTVSNVTSTTFDVNIDTTSFGTYDFAHAGAVCIWMTMDVGGRGPVKLCGTESGYSYSGVPGSSTTGSIYSGNMTGWQATYFGSPGSFRQFVYDGNIANYRDSSGVLHYGSWILGGSSSNFAVSNNGGIVPVEFIAALISELEDIIIANGQQNTVGPINPWVNVPCNSVISTDPNYLSSDNVAIGMCNVLRNGSTYNGITYRGIPSRCDIFVEYSNEVWNGSQAQVIYNSHLAQWRWGAASANQVDMQAYRSTQMAVDLKNYFNDPRIKPILGGQDVGAGWSSSFTGNVSGTSLTITGSISGTVIVGQIIVHPSVPFGTTISSGSGTSWVISQSAGTISGGQFTTGDVAAENNYNRLFGTTSLIADSSGTAAVPANTTPVYYSTSGYSYPATHHFGFAIAPYFDPSDNYMVWPAWQSGITYGSNYPGYNITNYVTGSDGVIYQSILGSNTGNNPTGGGSPTYWSPLGSSYVAGPTILSWSTNGTKTVSSVTAATSPVVTTSAPHGFSNGDFVFFWKMTGGLDPNGGYPINGQAFLVSNVGSTTFNINLDTTSASSITGGNVTRLTGSDQESLYTSWLATWMNTPNASDPNDGAGGNVYNSLYTNLAHATMLVPFGISAVGYEGWEQMNIQPNSYGFNATVDAAGDYYGFIAGVKHSNALGAWMTAYMNTFKNVYGGAIPSVFTYQDPGRWGFTFPSAYGFSPDGNEWTGLSPSWTAMANYNAGAKTQTLKITTT